MCERQPFHSKNFVVAGNWETIKNKRWDPKGDVVLPELEGEKEGLSDWNDERKFIEGLIYTRFAHLLTLTGAVLAGCIALKFTWPAVIVAFLGLLLSTCMSNGVRRSYAKATFLNAALRSYSYLPVAVTSFYFETGKEVQNLGRDEFLGIEALSWIGRWAPFWIEIWHILLIVCCMLSAYSHWAFCGQTLTQ